MSHRKIHSQAFVPFSWEEKPGIPKTIHQKSSSDSNLLQSSSLITCNEPDIYDGSMSQRSLISITPPPLQSKNYSQAPRKRSSLKRLIAQDDPFVSALKSCTKNITDGIILKGLSRRSNSEDSANKGFRHMIKSFNSVFSCKSICDIVDVENDDDVFKFERLPPLPKERYGSQSFAVKWSNDHHRW